VQCGDQVPQSSANSGFVVRSATDNLQRKQWQPRGGNIPFVIHLPNGFDNDATVVVCMWWQTVPPRGHVYPATARIDSISSTTRDPTIVITVPDLEPAPPRWQWLETMLGTQPDQVVLGTYTGLWLVPVSNVRIMVLDKTGAIKGDIVTAIGVTTQWWAILLALGSVALAFYLLNKHCVGQTPQLKSVNPILRVITTPKGYASLSQFQIMLWTFVVGASVIYVMALSGDLIRVTAGTLVLLGISGAATLGAQLQSKNEDRAANATATPTVPAAPSPLHTTSWCDLVVDEKQIDVTRLQMLYFTIVMAVFVLMTVTTRYEIPDIPESFLILMGISNGVYITAKFNK
jgi:hypothetical protein